MKLCRFTTATLPGVRVGLLRDDGSVRDLTALGVSSLSEILDSPDPVQRVTDLNAAGSASFSASEVELLSPVEHQEIWAAGVTYLRSKAARMEESDFSATAYDRVYDAPRPELFFKSLGPKASGPGGPAGIRADAKWNVPEPELVLVFNSRGEHVGYTIGNDMSSRDIEGENLLYLPQAKTYRYSCAVGPAIRIGVSEEEARTWTIRVTIERQGVAVFSGETSVSKIKRTFPELGGWLHRSQEFAHGAVLLTGTGVVPPNEFTLSAGDLVRIDISGIGQLANTVCVV
ncbi:MAG TPA: fumarylacetoacetate hydrolase family protein [Candidatus Limnocylindria bacterium]|jgi:2-dehydro-3-deoxy-D-arabinonate dehydratase|nr:fumarylacetoacetate hydrolase family protein [Candidatus Limnocylindria bacterium]